MKAARPQHLAIAVLAPWEWRGGVLLVGALPALQQAQKIEKK